MYPHTTDCFISYNDDFIVKEEKLSDSDPQLPKPYPSDDPFSSFLSPKKTRSESFAELTIQKLVSMDFLASVNKKRPFIIIRGQKRSQGDEIKVKMEPEKKLMDNNRKPRRRKSVKKEEDSSRIIVKKEAGICDEESEISGALKETEEKSQKKMVQMIRNRISAQNSRDRRKAQLKALEDGRGELSLENQRLWDEKKNLLKEIKKLEQSNYKLLEEKERLLKRKKKNNCSFTCMNCSGKGVAKAAQTGLSVADLEDLWKNMETMGLVGQEDYFGLSEEQKELGFSIGMTLGMAMMECMKGPNNEGSEKKGTSNGSKSTACSLFQEKEKEEEEIEFGRKFSRSTLASPNLSSLTHSSFISEDYELNKPALTSFWETISLGKKKSGNEEEKIMGNGEKKIWIDFQNKVMKENVMNGGSWKQRTSPLAKGGSVRLLNSQDF